LCTPPFLPPGNLHLELPLEDYKLTLDRLEAAERLTATQSLPQMLVVLNNKDSAPIRHSHGLGDSPIHIALSRRDCYRHRHHLLRLHRIEEVSGKPQLPSEGLSKNLLVSVAHDYGNDVTYLDRPFPLLDQPRDRRTIHSQPASPHLRGDHVGPVLVIHCDGEVSLVHTLSCHLVGRRRVCSLFQFAIFGNPMDIPFDYRRHANVRRRETGVAAVAHLLCHAEDIVATFAVVVGFARVALDGARDRGGEEYRVRAG
jgi:hypothetical protein